MVRHDYGFNTMFQMTMMLVVLATVLGTVCEAASPQANESQAPNYGPLEQALQDIDQAFGSGDYGNVDRLLIIHKGETLADRKYDIDYRQQFADVPDKATFYTNYRTRDSYPYNYMHPDWHPYYQETNLHSLQSVTKSITSVLIGIAITRGDLSGVDACLVDILEDEYDMPYRDEQLEKVKLHHLLAMRMNLQWDESGPFDTLENPVVSLEVSDDWAQFVLTHPMESDPGTSFRYNSGATQLLAAVLREATGIDIGEYARRHLFLPLGIAHHYWKKTPNGLSDAIGGLYLSAEDLAKIGLMMMNGGVWEGRRILSKDWVDASFTSFTDNISQGAGETIGYGYQWWLPISDLGPTAFAAKGFGGQWLIGLPENDLVIVLYGWNVDLSGTSSPTADPFDMLQEKLKSDLIPSLSD